MITIYSTPTCTYCKSAKDFFTQHNVEYTEIDVAANHAEAQKMIEMTGQMGVPVIVIEQDGIKEIILGFDKPKIMKILNIA